MKEVKWFCHAADIELEVKLPIRDAVALIRGLNVLDKIGAVSHIEYDFQFGDWCTDDEFLERLGAIYINQYTCIGEIDSALHQLYMWREGTRNHHISDNVGGILLGRSL